MLAFIFPVQDRVSFLRVIIWVNYVLAFGTRESPVLIGVFHVDLELSFTQEESLEAVMFWSSNKLFPQTLKKGKESRQKYIKRLMVKKY